MDNCCCRSTCCDNGVNDIANGIGCIFNGIGKGVCSGLNVINNAGKELGCMLNGALASNCCCPAPRSCRRPKPHQPACTCTCTCK